MSSRVGERTRRSEDPRLLTGRGRFVDDLDPGGCLHAAFARSEHAHATIDRVDVAAASEVPGFIAGYTAGDLGSLDAPLPLVVPDPDLHRPRTQTPLVRDEARFVGEPTAMVIATGRAAAEDAAERVEESYGELAVVSSLRQAAEAQELVHTDIPDTSGVPGAPDRSPRARARA